MESILELDDSSVVIILAKDDVCYTCGQTMKDRSEAKVTPDNS